MDEKVYFLCNDDEGCGMVHEDPTDCCDMCGGPVREVDAGDIDVY